MVAFDLDIVSTIVAALYLNLRALSSAQFCEKMSGGFGFGFGCGFVFSTLVGIERGGNE